MSIAGPRDVIDRWDREKCDWLKRRGYHTRRRWSDTLPLLSERERAEFQKQFRRCREDFLDTCHGECLLKRPELAQIVRDSLLHFDAQRYRMGDYVVMPNHAGHHDV